MKRNIQAQKIMNYSAFVHTSVPTEQYLFYRFSYSHIWNSIAIEMNDHSTHLMWVSSFLLLGRILLDRLVLIRLRCLLGRRFQWRLLSSCFFLRRRRRRRSSSSRCRRSWSSGGRCRCVLHWGTVHCSRCCLLNTTVAGRIVCMDCGDTTGMNPLLWFRGKDAWQPVFVSSFLAATADCLILLLGSLRMSLLKIHPRNIGTGFISKPTNDPFRRL